MFERHHQVKGKIYNNPLKMNNIYKKNHCQSGTLLTRYVIEQLSFGLKNSDEPLKRYLLSLTHTRHL